MVHRQIAYKLWIAQMHASPYVKQEGEWDPNYLFVKDAKVSRVQLVGTVVDQFQGAEGTYVSLVLDDGTDTVRVKTFKDDIKLLSGIKRGDIIRIIGRIREYEGEIYLSPEIVKICTEPNWELLHKAELLKTQGKPPRVQRVMVQQSPQETVPVDVPEEKIRESEQQGTQTMRQQILRILEQAPPEGIRPQDVSAQLQHDPAEIEAVIKEMLKEGEIYTPKPGFVKIL